MYRIKEKLAWGPKVNSVGVRFPLLLGYARVKLSLYLPVNIGLLPEHEFDVLREMIVTVNVNDGNDFDEAEDQQVDSSDKIIHDVQHIKASVRNLKWDAPHWRRYTPNNPFGRF